MNTNKTVKKGLFPYVFLFLFIITCLIFVNTLNTTVNELTYDEFMKNMNNNEITEMTITPKTRTETYEVVGKLNGYEENETFILQLPKSDEFISKIVENEEKNNFKLTINTDPEASSWLLVIVNVLPIALLVGVTFWLFTRQIGGNNKSMDFGKSRAKLMEEGSKTTFKDVAGLTEEKEEVKELIDFL